MMMMMDGCMDWYVVCAWSTDKSKEENESDGDNDDDDDDKDVDDEDDVLDDESEEYLARLEKVQCKYKTSL